MTEGNVGKERLEGTLRGLGGLVPPRELCAPSPSLISSKRAGGGLGREAAAARPYCRCAGAAESAAAA